MSAEKSQHYQTQKIMTASPAMLVFMLYEKAIGCLKEAIACIDSEELEGRWKANKRAMEIIQHMRLTLNTEQGGEIAANLDGIFGYLLRELPKVDLKNDPKPAMEGIGLLEPLCESWRQVVRQGDDAAQLAARAAPKTTPAKSGPSTPASKPKPTNPTSTKARPIGRSQDPASPRPPGGVTISA